MDTKTALIAAGTIGALLCSCGVVSTPSPFDDGHIIVSGDSRGMRAFGDALNGLVTNGKASPDTESASWKHRNLEDSEITRRANHSALSDLFHGSKTSESGS